MFEDHDENDGTIDSTIFVQSLFIKSPLSVSILMESFYIVEN